jgi:hypothetical protein
LPISADNEIKKGNKRKRIPETDSIEKSNGDRDRKLYFESVFSRLATLYDLFQGEFELQVLDPYFNDYNSKLYNITLPNLLKTCPFIEKSPTKNKSFLFNAEKLEIFKEELQYLFKGQ